MAINAFGVCWGVARLRVNGIVFGLENAPEAFIGLLQGRNFGKLVIQGFWCICGPAPTILAPLRSPK
jgi:hypothetical protein